MPPDSSTQSPPAIQEVSRSKKLQLLGILSGFAAGAWLGAAEAPTKLVSIGISPMVISLIMVLGVFLARWSLPALILGTSSVRADVRRAPHLVIWALLAGCLWAVANTLTIFAIRDIGLSIAFPLWNSNSILGILWGFLFFNELRQAGWRRRAGVLGGALVMCIGATRSWQSPPRQDKAQSQILYTGSGPPSGREFFGAPCTSLTAKPT